jgi:hypothetical protein
MEIESVLLTNFEVAPKPELDHAIVLRCDFGKEQVFREQF